METINNFELANIGPSTLKFDGAEIDIVDAEVLLSQHSVDRDGYLLIFIQYCFEGDMLLLQFYDRDLKKVDERWLPRNTDHVLFVQKTVRIGHLQIVDGETNEVIHEIVVQRHHQCSRWQTRWITVKRSFLESVKVCLLNYFFSCCGYDY